MAIHRSGKYCLVKPSGSSTFVREASVQGQPFEVESAPVCRTGS